ncbi:MAG: hypothetical protein N2738_00440 [Thermodesulfovibrionales bacterium]|nr:hypothetical protein [Thermodesulfovibrionales bacterium]
MQTYLITNFNDIIEALKENPEWREEMRKLVLTDELINLPKRFDNFIKDEFTPLKQDVAVLKQDVAALKGDNFERKVREKAPAFFGKLLRKTRVINIEDYAEAIDDANEKGLVTDKERDDALNIDVIVKGKIRGSDKEVILVCEVSVTVDNEDVERASRRAETFSKVFNKETIAVVVGQHVTDRSRQLADELSVLIV